MSWSIGYDENWKRDIGYGVPAVCDYPGCNAPIDRGLSYVCGGQPYGGEHGCGLYFCPMHLMHAGARREHAQVCSRCYYGRNPFDATTDTKEWVQFKLGDKSWSRWRSENPKEVAHLKRILATPRPQHSAVRAPSKTVCTKSATSMSCTGECQ